MPWKDPEKKKAAHKRQHDRLKADPVKYAAHMARVRAYLKKKRQDKDANFLEKRAASEARYAERMRAGLVRPNKSYDYAKWKETPGGKASLERNREKARERWRAKAAARRAAQLAAPAPADPPPAPVAASQAIAIAARPAAPVLTPSQRAEQHLAGLLDQTARVWNERRLAKKQTEYMLCK